MNFCDKLYSLLTARGGIIKYDELSFIVQTLINDACRGNKTLYVPPGLIITRWLSEGFLEIDREKGGVKLRRPTLYSCGNGKWTYVGARYSPAIEHLKANLKQAKIGQDQFAAPKLVFDEKFEQSLDAEKMAKLGCDILGHSQLTAAEILTEEAGSLMSRSVGNERNCDQAMTWLKWFKVSTKDFSLIQTEISQASQGHYILRNQGNNGRPITKYIKLLPNKQIISFEDWRWLYVSMLSDVTRMSEFFYEPRNQLFGVIRITGPYTRQENWLPSELAIALGAASAEKSITTATIQDVDGQTKSAVIYPNVSHHLALMIHNALGMNKIHPLRYLQY